MGSALRHVLVIGADQERLDCVAPMLRRAEFEVHTIPDSRFVLDLVRSTAFELLVVNYPTHDFPLEELVSAVRDDGSTCRSAGFLLLSDPNRIEEAQSYVERGVNRAVSVDWTRSRLWQVVGDLIKVEPRISLRSLVDIGVRTQVERQDDLCRTENVSTSGMLLHGAEAHGPGTAFDFSFSLPEDHFVVEGSGVVVRTANPDREGLEGFGARFLKLKPGCHERLARFIAAQLRPVH